MHAASNTFERRRFKCFCFSDDWSTIAKGEYYIHRRFLKHTTQWLEASGRGQSGDSMHAPGAPHRMRDRFVAGILPVGACGDISNAGFFSKHLGEHRQSRPSGNRTTVSVQTSAACRSVSAKKWALFSTDGFRLI